MPRSKLIVGLCGFFALSLVSCGGGGGDEGTAANVDSQPPTVVSASPAGGTMDTAVGASINVTFSETMDPASLNLASVILQDSDGNVVSGMVSYSGTTVTFIPHADLSYDATYTCRITTQAKDLAGNGLSGEYVWSFATCSAPVIPPSAALHQLGLNGTNQVAVHETAANPPASALDLATFTVEAWIFPSAGAVGEMIVVADGGYYLQVKPVSLQVEFTVMTSTDAYAKVSFAGTDKPLALDQWNHVAAMVDNASQTIRLAVNGELSVPVFMGGAIKTTYPQTFSVGNSYPQTLGDYPFIGRIDEVRLSSGIRYTVNAPPPDLLSPDGGTVGLWHFDEAAGATTFADASGNGYDLVGLGGAAAVAESRDGSNVASGRLQTDFGSGGVATSNPSALDEIPSTALIAAGDLYVVGYDQAQGDKNLQWRIEKRSLGTGELLPGFGIGGVVTSNPSASYDGATGAVSDGTSIYVAGYDLVLPNGDYRWRVEKRSLETGSLVGGFGANGVVATNPSPYTDGATALAIDGDALYVVGYDVLPGAYQWRIEKRDSTSGALVDSFGDGGVITNEVSPGVPTSVLVQNGSLYVAGWVLTGGLYQWRIEKRSLTTGGLVSDFGVGGVVAASPAGEAQPRGMVGDGTDLYLVGYGGPVDASDEWWLIEKRSLVGGNPDTIFGAGTAIVSNPSALRDHALALLLDGESLYAIGDDGGPAPGDFQWRLERRRLTTGGLVEDFGTWGVVTSNPSSITGSYRETANAIATDGTNIYVVGIDNSLGNAQWRIEKRRK